MHPNPAYRKATENRNIGFVRERSFGVLAINSENGPLMSHIPFQLSEDGSYLEAHLVRSNPMIRLLNEPVRAVIAITGGHAYISPDWYGVENQVPTWNYVAVHIQGMLERLGHEELHGILVRLSAGMEGRLTPKRPWKIGKMDTGIYVKLQRQIVPIAMKVDDIQGTWKLSQNKPIEVRESAMAGIRAARVGTEIDEVVKLMGLVRDD